MKNDPNFWQDFYRMILFVVALFLVFTIALSNMGCSKRTEKSGSVSGSFAGQPINLRYKESGTVETLPPEIPPAVFAPLDLLFPGGGAAGGALATYLLMRKKKANKTNA